MPPMTTVYGATVATTTPTTTVYGAFATSVTVPEADRAKCDTFTGCTGDLSKNKGKDVDCTGLADTCDIATCCTEEDSCFPGEAEVSVRDRSVVRVDEIELGMTVFAESGFEPIIGVMHVHSEIVPTFTHATTVSA